MSRPVWILAILVLGCQQPTLQLTPTATPTPTASSSPADKPLESLRPQSEGLEAFANSLQGRHAAAFYVNGVKAGFMVYEMKTVPIPKDLMSLAPGESKLVAEMTESVLQMEVMGQVNRHREKAITYFSLRGEGPLVWSKSDSWDDEEEEHLVVKKRAGQHEIWQDGKLLRKVPQSKMTLAYSQALESWLIDSRRTSGDRAETFEPDWREDPVDQQSIIVFHGRGTALWRQKPIEVFQVDMLIQGLRLQGEVTRHLLPLKARVAGMLEIRLEDEKQARQLDTVASWTDWGLPLNRPIEKPQEIERVQLRATSSEPLELPSNHRQTVKVVEGGWEIELRRETMPPVASPVGSEGLESDYTTRSTPAMVTLAEKLVSPHSDRTKQVKAILTWVFESLDKTSVGQATTAEMVFKSRQGDCTEHSVLFVALCKAAGIPARLAQGAMYVEGDTPFFGWHQWAEIHDGTGWVGVDPTWDQYGVDATHLLFDNDPKDLSSFNQIGRLKLELVGRSQKESGL